MWDLTDKPKPLKFLTIADFDDLYEHQLGFDYIRGKESTVYVTRYQAKATLKQLIYDLKDYQGEFDLSIHNCGDHYGNSSNGNSIFMRIYDEQSFLNYLYDTWIGYKKNHHCDDPSHF